MFYVVLSSSESMSARNAAEAAGRSGTNAAKANSLTGMSVEEARQILNIKDLEDTELIRKVSELVLSREIRSHLKSVRGTKNGPPRLILAANFCPPLPNVVLDCIYCPALGFVCVNYCSLIPCVGVQL